MFWCMFACDITAFYCDILQDCSGGQVFHSVNVMRIHALTCGLLQDSGIWTQNPPIARSWGFDPPSRHQISSFRMCSLRSAVFFVPKLCPKLTG
jgi:hypothetical protein